MTETTDVAVVRQRIAVVVAQLEQMTVATDAEMKEAGEFLRKIKQTDKIIHEVLDPQIKELYEPYKAKTDERKAYLDQLTGAEKAVKRMIGTYQTDQARARAFEERKAREAEEERRLNIAIDTGHEEVLERPVVSVKPPEPEKMDGVYSVTVWEWELLDKAKINPMFLTVDEKAINSIVRTKKDEAAAMVGDGIRVYSRQDVRARA